MQDIYYITDIEQLKIFSDPLRIQIIRELADEPKTSKMISVILKLAPSKVNYHLTELERVGLVQIVKKELKNGIQQKFYSPIAKIISLSKVDEIVNDNQDHRVNQDFSHSIKEVVSFSLKRTFELVEKLEVIDSTFVHLGHNLLLSEENRILLDSKINEINDFIATNNLTTDSENAEKVHLNLTYFPNGGM